MFGEGVSVVQQTALTLHQREKVCDCSQSQTYLCKYINIIFIFGGGEENRTPLAGGLSHVNSRAELDHSTD